MLEKAVPQPALRTAHQFPPLEQQLMTRCCRKTGVERRSLWGRATPLPLESNRSTECFQAAGQNLRNQTVGRADTPAGKEIRVIGNNRVSQFLVMENGSATGRSPDPRDPISLTVV